MDDWKFKYSVYTKAQRNDAWNYWTNVENHAEMESGVKSIELDGPFASGMTGRTITSDYTQEWELTEVVEKERWVITGHTPDGTGKLSFAWEFEDEGSGTRMTQRITANETLVKQHPEEIQIIEENAPAAMSKLAAELDRLANEQWDKN